MVQFVCLHNICFGRNEFLDFSWLANLFNFLWMIKMLNPLPNSILKKYPEGSVTQWFGENKELYLKAIRMPGHPGIDIYQPYGTPIIAPYNGRISGVHLQDANKIGGNQIDLFSDIQPSGLVYETMFAHCSEILVKKDQRVKAGETIGKVGNSGFVVSGGIQYWQNSNPDNRGTHLHLGLRLWKPLRPGDMESLVIQNQDNGFNGWIDPMLFVKTPTNTMQKLKLIQQKGEKDIWIVDENGQCIRIANIATFDKLFELGIIGDWLDIQTQIEPVNGDKTILIYNEE